MDSSTLRAFCPTSEFAHIEAIVREWPGVQAVGSLRAKENKKDITTVFIKFKGEESAKEATALIKNVPGLSQTNDEKNVKEGNQRKSRGKNASKNLVAELMHFETYEDRKRSSQHQRKRNFENKNINSPNNNNNNYQNRRSGKTGRGTCGERQQNGGGRRQIPFIPPSEVSVAVVDNVPFNMTNDQLIEVFSSYGRVMDLNRYELMAMVFYDSSESVLHCIQQLNGKTIKGNVISVSSGSVNIPGPVAVQMGI